MRIVALSALMACGTSNADLMPADSTTPDGGNAAQNEITAFAFTMADNPSLAADITATITGTQIAAPQVPAADLHSLVPVFTTAGAVTVAGIPQSSGVTTNDFRVPVTYTVTGYDGSTRQYTVTAWSSWLPGDITSFAFLAANNPQLAADYEPTGGWCAIIEGKVAQIACGETFDLPLGPITALVPTFTTGDGAPVTVDGVVQISGVTAVDFTHGPTYEILTESGFGDALDVYVTTARPGLDVSGTTRNGAP